MKDVIVDVIKEYGTEDIHYCLILYGSDASTKFSFTSDPVDPKQFQSFVTFMPQIEPPSSPHAALEQASRAFRGRGVRVNASKVLVVMTDTSGDSSEKELEAASVPLKQLEVKIITVALGKTVDEAEIVKISRDKDNVILASLDEDSEELSKILMKEVFKPGLGVRYLFLFSCHFGFERLSFLGNATKIMPFNKPPTSRLSSVDHRTADGRSWGQRLRPDEHSGSLSN